MTTTQTTELTKEKIQKAVNVIIDKMPPTNSLHRQVLAAFRDENYVEVKKLAAFHPTDKYAQAISYLGGAFNPQAISSGNTFTILAESARNVGHLVGDRIVQDIGAEIAEVLG
ncbi:hypothetical protein LC605_15005 [Nostoc sp. CHAB 5836]|uniref:hypothetical protein n=1 Tax=Nostoc sp. CHAB 5836 TaxID=2780404 RepID=UPI001E4AE871|nr:hypothetical protein [Nostoc sp. CHAB 5836]MCC5616354.1 hypothetical protein [Nostoc sp. CHAB 5836]